MRTSTSLLANGFSLLVFLAGSVVALFSWDVGLTIMLVSLGLACISRYRAASTGFAGSLALVPALLVFLYAYGAVEREAPVYYTNVSSTVWAIIAVGSVTLIAGLWMAGGAVPSEPKLRDPDFSSSGFFLLIGYIALALSAVNYTTGDIALFSTDINSARFAGNYGVVGQLWSLIHPVTQISVVVFLLKLRSRRMDFRWTVLGICSAISLVLSGGRSLSTLALIAFGVLFIELQRPKLRTIAIALLVGLVAFGAIGQIRAMSSSTATEAASYMAKRDLNSWFGSTDLSLQTGPRVMTLAIDQLNDGYLGGQFMLADLPRVGDSSVVRSDQLVTLMLGRDPAIVGGSPPTLFGGLYLDFGWLGVIIGSLLIGSALAISRRMMYQNPSLSTCVWFSYFAAYISISGYSYVSLRPSWIVVLLLCIVAGGLSNSRGLSGQDTHGLEVCEVPGRRRAPHVRSNGRFISPKSRRQTL